MASCPVPFEFLAPLLTCSSLAEVSQQSKARHKEDFVTAFAPIIAEATALAYKGAPNEVLSKLRRVVEVWKARSIFEAPIQAAIETRIEGTHPLLAPKPSPSRGNDCEA